MGGCKLLDSHRMHERQRVKLLRKTTDCIMSPCWIKTSGEHTMNTFISKACPHFIVWIITLALVTGLVSGCASPGSRTTERNLLSETTPSTSEAIHSSSVSDYSYEELVNQIEDSWELLAYIEDLYWDTVRDYKAGEEQIEENLAQLALMEASMLQVPPDMVDELAYYLEGFKTAVEGMMGINIERKETIDKLWENLELLETVHDELFHDAILSMTDEQADELISIESRRLAARYMRPVNEAIKDFELAINDYESVLMAGRGDLSSEEYQAKLDRYSNRMHERQRAMDDLVGGNAP